MKKMILSFMAIVAAAMFFSSCEQEKVNAQDRIENEEVLLSVGLQDELYTKGQTAWTKQQESAVVSWQVFVFNEDGSLDVSSEISGSGSASLKCTTGKKAVYALVNSPNSYVGKNGIRSKSELLAIKSNLSDNTAGTSFVMFGNSDITLSSSSSMTIKVDRVCSKVYIDSIENKLSGSYGSITIKGIYLTNVAGDAVLGNSTYVPETSGKWYNKMAYAASGVATIESMLSETSLSEVVAKNGTSSQAHYFYCYPNGSTSTAQAGQWSPRCTRLVIETVVAGDSEPKRYYVINLLTDGGKGIERNKFYHIKKLSIQHLGSTDPDKEVGMNDVSVNISVNDWTEGFEKETIYY